MQAETETRLTIGDLHIGDVTNGNGVTLSRGGFQNFAPMILPTLCTQKEKFNKIRRDF